MVIGTSTSFVSAFLASFVEAVEALTIVIAAGATRGWKPALMGTGFAMVILTALTIGCGPFLLFLPGQLIQLFLGLLLLYLGVRWLRKAILRAAGVIPLRDEAIAYARTEEQLRLHAPVGGRFDAECFATAFYGVFVEGFEIVLIVLSLGAAGKAFLLPGAGAALACLAVIALGLFLHRPLTRIPENWLKFAVGILLTSFGLFWAGEGLGFHWPAGDAALLALVAGICGLSFALVSLARKRARSQPN